MDTSYSKPKNFIKLLQIIHFVLLMSVVVFGAYVAVQAEEQLFFSYKEDKTFLYLAILIAFIGNLASKFMYSKLLNRIPLKIDLLQKEIKYSTAQIVRMAMLEFPAFMCVIFVMKSNNSFYFILVGVLILMLLAIYPTKNKFINDVPLTTKEKSIIEKL